MARKAVERNISYDDVRQLYYVSMELGRDENGKRIKQYRTFPTLTAARNGLRDFHTQRERQAREPQDEVREEMDLAHWLEYWMESIVRPNRAETTVYAYQKIIDNHILPALGGIPMSQADPAVLHGYPAGGRAVLQHHAAAPRPSLQRPALRGAAGYASGLAHGPGGAAAVPGQGGLLL